MATVNADGVVQTKGLGRTVIRATALGDVLNNDEVCNYRLYLICPCVVILSLAACFAATCSFLCIVNFFNVE